MVKSVLVPSGVVVKIKKIIHEGYLTLYNHDIGVDTIIIPPPHPTINIQGS